MQKLLIDDNLGRLDWLAHLGELPAWRRERVLRLRRESDRLQAVAAWLLLRRCCRETLLLSDVPPVAHSASGKPFFPTLPDVHFNLSHCPVAVACAMGSEPVGVDVEAVAPLDLDVARHVFSDNELRQVLADASPGVAFARVWTMKECWLKRHGEGISSDLRPLLNDVDARELRTIIAPDGRWVCTVSPWRVV